MELLDYVRENQNISFSEKAFGELDALVLARLAFYNLQTANGKRFKDLKECEDLSVFTNTLNLKDSDLKILEQIVASNRYSDILIDNFVVNIDPVKEEQFGALCYYLDPETVVMAFRGTDGTLLGWKENFNLITMDIIPSQESAVKYFKDFYNNHSFKNIYMIGHSKGGNLAIYASANAPDEIKNKIVKIYNFDGPGFVKKFYKTPEYLSIRNKIVKLMPSQSIIGRILYDENYEIIIAHEELFLQHWPLYWSIVGDRVERTSRLEAVSNAVDLTLDDLQEKFTNENRTEMVNYVFSTLALSGKEYLEEIIFDKKEFKLTIKRFLHTEDNKKELFKFVWKIYRLFKVHYRKECKIENKILGKAGRRQKKRRTLFLVVKDNILKNLER